MLLHIDTFIVAKMILRILNIRSVFTWNRFRHFNLEELLFFFNQSRIVIWMEMAGLICIFPTNPISYRKNNSHEIAVLSDDENRVCCLCILFYCCTMFPLRNDDNAWLQLNFSTQTDSSLSCEKIDWINLHLLLFSVNKIAISKVQSNGISFNFITYLCYHSSRNVNANLPRIIIQIFSISIGVLIWFSFLLVFYDF